MTDIPLIKIPLLVGETDAVLTHQHVLNEVERISLRLGRDFNQFIIEEGDNIFFVAAEGALHPDNWMFIPRYGTDGEPADGPASFALFFLLATGFPFANHHIKWADFQWECW